MNDKPLWLVSYDIGCNKRLKKVYRLLLTEGWALQKSVFVVPAAKPRRLAMIQELEQIMDFEQDRLLWLPYYKNEDAFHKGQSGVVALTFLDQRLQGIVL
jgi:CRISPR/Cas system-associated endoribonuclease Cas2